MKSLLKRAALATAIAATVSGCSIVDDYEFGDGMRAVSKVVNMKKNYCSDTNGESRELLLTAIRLADPDYDGVCDHN